MRGGMIVIVLLLVAASQMSGMRKADLTARAAKQTAVGQLAADPVPGGSGETKANRVDFVTQVKPILVSRCEGCHFPGGKMYQQLPFDRAETIKTLGEKLFTRIKDENDRRVIRDFLAQ